MSQTTSVYSWKQQEMKLWHLLLLFGSETFSETWETQNYFYALGRKENPTLNVVVWVWLIKLMHKQYLLQCFSLVQLLLALLAFFHVWSYSFKLLMHHLLLTKSFLAVTSLMLFPAFSLPQSMFCAFSQAPWMLWMWCSCPVLLTNTYEESSPAF